MCGVGRGVWCVGCVSVGVGVNARMKIVWGGFVSVSREGGGVWTGACVGVG